VDGGRYVGLVRIWNGPLPVPRLGLIGVLPDYRRRGLAKDLNRALRRQCFSALLDPQITPYQLHAQLVGTVAAYSSARGVAGR
jgi:ribosomal protein S18 acetylase RimI-like enzyme